MSIQSTKEVTRDWAIQRIKLICDAMNKKDYRFLNMVSFESDYDLQTFVDEFVCFDTSNIEGWTDLMLDRKLNDPFFRESIFDNYIIEGE